MTTEDNKEIVRRIVAEGWNEQNLDTIDELYSPDYVGRWYLPGGEEGGREELKEFMNEVFEGFPDYEMHIEFIHGEDDLVTYGFTGSGTHEGTFMGIPPTETEADVGEATPGHVTSRIEDGVVVEGWSTWDALGLLQALGVLPENLQKASLAADD
jgi:predicted ester cyclase